MEASSPPHWEQGHRGGGTEPSPALVGDTVELSEHGVIEGTAGEPFSLAAHLSLRGAGAGPCSLQSKHPFELGAAMGES